MKTLFGITVALGAFAAAAAGQENVQQQKATMKAQVEIDQMLRGAKVIGIEAGIMGPAVKGAPYSAEEVHETTQVLADGTRIHNEAKTSVYRDSAGRVRRESPGQVMIWDSAAGSSYVLDQSSQTGHKVQMNYLYRKTGPADGAPEPPGPATFRFSTAEGPDSNNRHVIVLKDISGVAAAEMKAPSAGAVSQNAKKETLPPQIIEGVTCEGTRSTTTINAGAIGNDRPIQITEERWYSPELQVNLLVKKTDPRIGEEVTRLTNVSRQEPDPTLFTVPSSYQLK